MSQDLEANYEPKSVAATGPASSNSTGDAIERTKTVTLLPFGGEFQPGPYLYKPTTQREFANPAPLGLCAFALTTFILSLINANTRGVAAPNVVVGAAYAYGGLIQLLAGMWEMAIGNTFGATALSSYGGFWISWAIIETGAFGIVGAYKSTADVNNAVGYYLLAWFLFTTMLTFCTFKSTVAFCSLFVFLDITFMLLAIGHLKQTPTGGVDSNVIHAAGVFGLITAFIAWWNALAGIADKNNSFFTIPVLHFPWSEKKVNDRRLAQQADKVRQE